jgi:hypothetical protein
MATIVMVRMLSALGMRHDGADAEINKPGRSSRMNRVGSGISNSSFRKVSPDNSPCELRADEIVMAAIALPQ